MRVILKPAGALIVLGAIVALALLYYGRVLKDQTLAAFEESSPTNADSYLTGDGAKKDLVRAPKNGELVSPDMQRWNLVAFLPARVTRKFVTYPNPPWKGSTHGTRLVVAAINPATGAESVQMMKAIPVAVRSGATITVDFWARSATRSTIETVIAEGNADTEELGETVSLTPEWKPYHYSVTAKRSYDSGRLTFLFRLGNAPGETEFAQVVLSAK